jgi:uncharacterized protein DUF6494
MRTERRGRTAGSGRLGWKAAAKRFGLRAISIEEREWQPMPTSSPGVTLVGAMRKKGVSRDGRASLVESSNAGAAASARALVACAPDASSWPPLLVEEARVDEDTFNMSVRKFLKTLGVTAQREIELAVREQLEAGELRGDETLEATARVTVRGLPDDVVVAGKIALS